MSRKGFGFGLTALAALICSLLLAASASAAAPTLIGEFACSTEHPCAGATSWLPGSLAVDEATGDVYVTDHSNDAVERFDSAGNFIEQLLVPEAAGETFAFTPEAAIAVDNSGGVNQGTVYVASGSHEGPVFAFAPDGSFRWVATGFAEPCGIAVNSSGQLYVDSWGAGVQQVDPENGSFEGAPLLVGNYCAIGFDSSDNIFISYLSPVMKFLAPAYTESEEWTEESTNFFSVDLSSDTLYAAPGAWVKVYDSPKHQTEFDNTASHVLAGIAVNGSTGKVYVSNTTTSDVEIYARQGGAAPKPSARTGEASPVEAEGAILHGKTNPDGAATTCEFEYGTTTALGESQPCSASAGSGTSEVSVSAQLTGLQPETTYYYRLVTTSANGTTKGSLASFTTHAPPPTQTLTVTRDGIGSGTVTSVPAGIDCGSTCSAEFEEGTMVTLTAAAGSGSSFAGWSGGGCSGTGACQVTLSGATSVTATFNLKPTEGGGSTGGGGSTAPPPPAPQETYGQCVSKAVKVYKKAKKSAAHKRGKAKGQAMKAANKAKHRAIVACKARFA